MLWSFLTGHPDEWTQRLVTISRTHTKSEELREENEKKGRSVNIKLKKQQEEIVKCQKSWTEIHQGEILLPLTFVFAHVPH